VRNIFPAIVVSQSKRTHNQVIMSLVLEQLTINLAGDAAAPPR
jgi:hypothetical protein